MSRISLPLGTDRYDSVFSDSSTRSCAGEVCLFLSLSLPSPRPEPITEDPMALELPDSGELSLVPVDA